MTFTFEPSEISSGIPAPLRFPDSRILDSKNLEFQVPPSLSFKPINQLIFTINKDTDSEREFKDKGIKTEGLKRGRIPNSRNLE